jgi:chitinase
MDLRLPAHRSVGDHPFQTLTGTIRAGTLVRLHPSGKFIYGANNGLSPSDFEKYGIGTSATAGTAATYLYDSPYHGDYAFDGNVWISEDGLRLFARSGNAFRSSEVRAEDMLYGGALQGMSAVQWVVQSTAAGKVFALPGATFNGEGASELRVYDSAVLAYRGASVLPRYNIPSVGSYASHGRFVFTRADGARVYVIVQADGAAGLAQDWGVVTYQTAELP